MLTEETQPSCPYCRHSLQAENSTAHFCAACLACITEDVDCTHIKKYHFNFTRKGWFALISERNLAQSQQEPALALESFYIEIAPLIDKMKSHLAWLFIIASLLLAFGIYRRFSMEPSLAPSPYTSPLFYFAAAAFMSSCLLIGYYWSALMMGGSFRPLFFPPREEKLFRLCLKGKILKAEKFLYENDLQKHPGCLSNLALACFNASNYAKGWQYLDRALVIAPTHPALKLVARDFSKMK